MSEEESNNKSEPKNIKPPDFGTSISQESMLSRLEILETQISDLNSKLQGKSNQPLQPATEASNLPFGVNQFPRSSNSHWLDDVPIKAYVQTFTEVVAKIRQDVLFVDPTVSQFLKLGSHTDTTKALLDLKFQNKNFFVFCVNNCNEENTNYRGSHWSLLIFSRLDQVYYHFDSIQGLNAPTANKLLRAVRLKGRFVEVPVTQQLLDFECGIHLLVNCQYIINYYFTKSLEYDSFQEFIDLHYFNKKVLKFKTKQGVPEQLHCSKTTHSNPSVNKSQTGLKLNCSNRINSSYMKTKNTNVNCASTAVETYNYYSLLSSEEDDVSFEEVSTKSKATYSKNDTMETKSNRGIKRKKINKNKRKHDYGPRLKPYTRFSPIGTVVLPELKPKPKFHLISDSHGRKLVSTLKEKLPNYTVSASVYPGATLTYLVSQIQTISKYYDLEDTILIVGGTNYIDLNQNYDVKSCIRQILLSINSK